MCRSSSAASAAVEASASGARLLQGEAGALGVVLGGGLGGARLLDGGGELDKARGVGAPAADRPGADDIPSGGHAGVAGSCGRRRGVLVVGEYDVAEQGLDRGAQVGRRGHGVEGDAAPGRHGDAVEAPGDIGQRPTGLGEDEPGAARVAGAQPLERGSGRLQIGDDERVGRPAERCGHRRLPAGFDGEQGGQRADDPGGVTGEEHLAPVLAAQAQLEGLAAGPGVVAA